MWQQRSRVPQFGKWNTGEDVAYTVYFEKAREQRGGVGVKVGNPNDPQENPELHPNGAPESKFAPPPGPKPRVATEESRGPEPARMAQDRRARADDSDLRRSINPSVRKDNAASRTNDSRQASGEPYKRPAGSNPGYDHSADRLPLHHQAKASGGAAYGSSPGGHGRARARADDSVRSKAEFELLFSDSCRLSSCYSTYSDLHVANPFMFDTVHILGTCWVNCNWICCLISKLWSSQWILLLIDFRLSTWVLSDKQLSGGAAVPKFGEWNVNDPASGDGYTDVFNRIKEERQRGPGTAMSPGPNVRGSPYTGNRKPNPRDNPKVYSRCFTWRVHILEFRLTLYFMSIF